ncbi:MAG TPA: FdhF/YdeP family oxidoreductase [Opitutaceae bacterium]
MTSHRIKHTWLERVARLVPFGFGHTKPRHFTDMIRVGWANRDNAGYAWKVLSKGVCDGCALGVSGFHDWTIKGTHLCMTRLNLLRLNTMPAMDPALLADVSKLETLDNAALRGLGRLAHPMLRRTGERGFSQISWEEALRLAGDRIRRTVPDRFALFITSRGVTNEIYYVGQKVARFLGTNNVDNAARLCHSPSTVAMKAAIGVSASTCSYEDWIGSDLVVFFGSNPANDQPVSTKYLELARKRGTKVVIVNPLLEPGMKRYWVPSNVVSSVFGTDMADYWFPVAQGGDIAFLHGVLKRLIETGNTDRDFLVSHCKGQAGLFAQSLSMPWEAIERQSGLSRDSIDEFASVVARSRTGVFVWSMGITQHAFGGDAVRMVLNVALARGFIGRPYCGVMPIRGHSSVQGGAEMGAYATAFPGGKPVNAENAAALSAQYGFEVPATRGLVTTEMLESAHRGELDVLYAVGGNFLRTLPEPEHVRETLERVPFRIHQDILVTDQMLVPAREAVLLLPAQTRYEQTDGGTETSTERRVKFTPEIPRQVGEARAEWRILRDVAAAVHPDRAHLLGCESGQAIRDEIARVVPFYDGVQHLKKAGDVFQYGGRLLCVDGVCPTPDGRAHLASVPLPAIDRPEGMFHCSTRRGKQFNTLVYAEVDPLTGAPRDAVLMNVDDAASLHLKHGDRVTLASDTGRLEASVFLAPLARGNLQVHWPEGNTIVPRGRTDTHGGVPDYNALVRVEIPGRRA